MNTQLRSRLGIEPLVRQRVFPLDATYIERKNTEFQNGWRGPRSFHLWHTLSPNESIMATSTIAAEERKCSFSKLTRLRVFSNQKWILLHPKSIEASAGATVNTNIVQNDRLAVMLPVITPQSHLELPKTLLPNHQHHCNIG